MKLPNLNDAVVSQSKIVDYLLSVSHRDGRHKAAFFIDLGFSAANWQVLASALLRHAHDHDVTRVEDSPFGTRYVVEGIINAPDGRTPRLRTVWFVEKSEKAARLVSAYPLKRIDT